jgi:dihydrofolate synthase/folylpolyglutamate synthase
MEVSQSILARFLALHPREIDLSLGRMERLLAEIGHPERAVPPVIHVAGTNGKGSVVAFLRAMLEAAGKTAHVYTSPHLVRFHERIRLGAPGGGILIDEAELVALFEEVERLNRGQPITLFEITTAAALLAFARHPADVLLLEVGLGGRLDATNVVPQTIGSVITSVSVDHTKFLGDTLEAIAFEKAGILKFGVPAVIAHQAVEALAVIERQARRVRAPLRVSGENWRIHEEHGRLVFDDDDGLLDLPLPRLAGRHQHENAGAAIAILRALPQLGVAAEAIERGLTEVEWPARMQRFSSGHLLSLLPEGSELWLDGGHNPDGGRAVAAAMAELEERVPRPLVLVVGMLDSKDSDGFLDPFRGLARHVHAVPVAHSAHSRSPDEVADAARRIGIAATAHGGLGEALQAVESRGGEPPRVLITGSLYLAGEALAHNGTLPR